MYAEHIPAKGNSPVLEQKSVQMVGEGVGFERIRRITGYLVARLTASTTASAPRSGIV